MTHPTSKYRKREDTKYNNTEDVSGCDTGRRDEWGEGCAGEAESVLSAW